MEALFFELIIAELMSVPLFRRTNRWTWPWFLLGFPLLITFTFYFSRHQTLQAIGQLRSTVSSLMERNNSNRNPRPCNILWALNVSNHAIYNLNKISFYANCSYLIYSGLFHIFVQTGSSRQTFPTSLVHAHAGLRFNSLHHSHLYLGHIYVCPLYYKTRLML